MFFSTRRKLNDTLDRLETLERRFKTIETEWNDVYDKMLRALSRIVKSRAKLQIAEDTPQPGEPENNGGQPGFPGHLSQRAREIQQQILRRRAGLGAQ